MPETDKKLAIIRPRAYIIAIFFAVLICALTPFNNVYRNATPLGGGYFPLAPFYLLFWLTVITALARKLFNIKTLLSGTELLFTWGLMILVSGIAYTGFARTFFINLTAPYYFASVENRWQEVLHPFLLKNLFPQDGKAIEMLYNGIDGGQDMGWLELASRVPWNTWALPFLSWGVFIFICYFLQ